MGTGKSKRLVAWLLAALVLAVPPAGRAADPPAEAEKLYQRGLTNIRDGLNVAAIQDLQRALKLDPGNALYRRYLGSAQANAGHFKDAIANYQAAIKLAPDDAETHYRLGVIYARMGRWAECVHEWEETLRINPAHRNVMDWLPRARTRSRSVEVRKLPSPLAEALKAPSATATPKPGPNPSPTPISRAQGLNADAHMALAAALQEKNNLGGAISELRAAIKLRPADKAAHLQLGELYGRLGNWVGAVAEYNEALKIDPYDNIAVTALPLAEAELRAQALGQRPRAWTSPKPFLAAEPASDAIEYHFAQGNQLYRAENFLAAAARYRESLRFIPDSLAARYNLGLCYYQLGRYPEAAAEFRVVVARHPNYAAGHYNLALMLDLLDYEGEAAEEFATYLRQSPGAGDAVPVRQRIRNLKEGS